jgi:class 3 adenylate cyclase
MLDQGNRTFIGSVVFVDIVGYSKKSVSEQITVKDRFTALLSESLVDIPTEQRLILDTGDGAALSFLGDPEDALFVGMNLRDMVDKAIAEAAATSILEPPLPDAPPREVEGALPLRIGINLGPVKLVRDINGHPNIVGDGINVAQRIMSFARPGQIVVSRSFYDVVSVISDEYAKLFKYEGSRTDKHVREHEIYIVGESAAAFKQAKAGTVDRAAATNPNARAQRQAGVSTGTYAATALNDGEALPFLQDRRKLMIAGGALALVVFALATMLALKKPAEKSAATTLDESKSAAVSSAPSVKGETGAASSSPPSIDASKSVDVPGTVGTALPPIAAGATQTSNIQTPSVANNVAVNPAPTAATSSNDTKFAAAKPDTAKADAAKAALVEGRLNLSIQPWGDVFVNGKSIGVSPPLKQHKLPPGNYRIEVRNTSFTPFKQNIELKPKEEINVKHKFQ